MRARLQSQYGLSTRGINVLMRVGTEDERASSLSHDQQEPRNDKGESLDAAGLPAFVDAVEYFEQVANGRNAQSAMNW